MNSTRITWLLEDQLVYWHCSGQYTNAQIATFINRIVALFDGSSGQTIHLVLNIRDAKPTGSINECQRSIRPLFTHPKLGWIILCDQGNPPARFILMLQAAIFRVRIKSAVSCEEAIAFLQAQKDITVDLSKLQKLNFEKEVL